MLFMRTSKVKKVLEEILDGSPYAQADELTILVDKLKEIVGTGDSVPELEKKIFELKKEVSNLKFVKKEEVAEIKLEHDIADRDLKHLVKIKERQLNVTHQERVLTVKSEYKDKELELQREYFDKTIGQIEQARADMRDMYEQVLIRLPNVNMDIQKDIQITKSSKK